jgi:hypothetical protein
MSARFGYRALRWAAWAALVSLCLMAWGVIDPHPISLVVAMTVGQALGTLSFGVYALVVLNDLRRARVLSSLVTRLSGPPAPPSSGPPSAP